MAIYTPRGLKLRLSLSDTFGLMARLYPRIDPFKVLKLTEGLESIPGVLAFIIGCVGFYFHYTPIQIAALVFLISLAGKILTTFGLYIIPGLPKLGTIYSYFSGYGILALFMGIYGYLQVGPWGVVAFFSARLLTVIVGEYIDAVNIKRIDKKMGGSINMTMSEMQFFNAYRLLADSIGVTTDITLSEEEAKQESWGPCFEDFIKK